MIDATWWKVHLFVSEWSDPETSSAAGSACAPLIILPGRGLLSSHRGFNRLSTRQCHKILWQTLQVKTKLAILLSLLLNVLEQKTVFTKVIVHGRYKMVFPSFGEFHQKKFPAFYPLLEFQVAVGQLTMLLLCARAFEIPVKSTLKVSGRCKYTHTHYTWLKDWILQADCIWLPINSPFTNFESARGKSVLPAVLVVLRVKNFVFVFFRRDVLLPLLVTVAVLPTEPTVISRLRKGHNI